MHGAIGDGERFVQRDTDPGSGAGHLEDYAIWPMRCIHCIQIRAEQNTAQQHRNALTDGGETSEL